MALIHNCALKSDGSLACWGYNKSPKFTHPPEGNDFIQVSAGAAHACALESDGSLVCWGDNEFGQSAPPAGNDYVYKGVLADFTVDKNSGEPPLTVQFTDASTIDEPITSWAWDFDNDGTIDSTAQHPTYACNEKGLYSANLTVSDGENEHTISFFFLIHTYPPVTKKVVRYRIKTIHPPLITQRLSCNWNSE